MRNVCSGFGVLRVLRVLQVCYPGFLAGPALLPAYNLTTPQQLLDDLCGENVNGTCLVSSRQTGYCGFIASSGTSPPPAAAVLAGLATSRLPPFPRCARC